MTMGERGRRGQRLLGEIVVILIGKIIVIVIGKIIVIVIGKIIVLPSLLSSS